MNKMLNQEMNVYWWMNQAIANCTSLAIGQKERLFEPDVQIWTTHDYVFSSPFTQPTNQESPGTPYSLVDS
jgi:hypothetical protein